MKNRGREIVKHKAASANLDGAPETEHLSAWVVAWLAIMYVFSRLFAWI